MIGHHLEEQLDVCFEDGKTHVRIRAQRAETRQELFWQTRELAEHIIDTVMDHAATETPTELTQRIHNLLENTNL
jgi:hypothetical protein